MDRPLKQIGDEIRELTDEELQIFNAEIEALRKAQNDEETPTE